MKQAYIIEIYRKTGAILLTVVFILFLMDIVFLLELTTYSFKKTCKSVGSFKDAQFALARGWSNLDRDNDGKACE